MKYTILATRIVDDLLFTQVAYKMDDGTEVTVEIPHFQPQTVADVLLGIVNRSASEAQKAMASTRCEAIKAELEAGASKTAGAKLNVAMTIDAGIVTEKV
jgi:hypothetical protein